MSRVVCHLFLVANLILLGLQTHAAAAEPAITVPAEGASMPMLDFGGRPVVEVRINGQGPFQFIFDTGAMQTVVDSGLSDQVSLPSSFRGTVLLDPVQIGAASLHDYSAVVAPISAMLGGGNAPRGVLSALAFPGYLVTFDYPNKRITLRQGALKLPDNQTVFAYEAGDELPTVPVKVAGHDLRVHLDTGAPYSLSLPTKYKDQIPLTGPLTEGHKARSPSGEYPVFKGTVKGEIEIGQHKLASPEVIFTDIVPRPDATPQGQLGGAALRDFAITLDSANRRIEFARPAASAP